MLDRDTQLSGKEPAGTSGTSNTSTPRSSKPSQTASFNPSLSAVRSAPSTRLVSYGGGSADAGEVIVAPDWGWRAWASAAWAKLMADPAIVFALTIFTAHRLLLFALGTVFAPLAPIDPPLGAGLLRDIDPRHWGPSFFLLGPWQRWDTNWYLQIAHFGYSVGNGTTNYPPLYPLSVGVLGRVLLDQYMLAAQVISNLAYIFALVYMYRLTNLLFNVENARRSILFLATFPTAFFLVASYTESLYLALVLAAFYYGEKQRWLLVALLVGLASITRLQGAILMLPLAYMYMQQRGFNWRKIDRNGLALAFAPSTIALYMLYVYLILGDYNFNNHLQVVWHIKFALPWESFFGGMFGFFDPTQTRNLFYNAVDFILLVVFICLTIIWAQKKLPMAYLLYSILSLAVFLTREGTDGFFWMSMNRYLLTIFPAFILAGQIAPRSLLKFGAGMQAIWATLFIFWMWAG